MRNSRPTPWTKIRPLRVAAPEISVTITSSGGAWLVAAVVEKTELIWLHICEASEDISLVWVWLVILV